MKIFVRPTPQLLDSDLTYNQALYKFDGFICHRDPKVNYLFPRKFKSTTIEALEEHCWNLSQRKSPEEWIVLNEVIDNYGQLRQNQMYRAYGELNWLHTVVDIASRYLSGRLWISDTGLHLEKRWSTIHHVAKTLGLGVGMQVHWNFTQGWIGNVKRVAGLPLLRYRLKNISKSCPVSLPEITIWESDFQKRKRAYESVLEAGRQGLADWAGIWVPTSAEHWGVPVPSHFLEL